MKIMYGSLFYLNYFGTWLAFSLMLCIALIPFSYSMSTFYQPYIEESSFLNIPLKGGLLVAFIYFLYLLLITTHKLCEKLL